MDNNNALISVIVPAYNVERYIRKCLDSVCNQTYRNLEILVIDDGSTDGTGAICDEFAAKDQRITVMHCENGGLSIARNRALDRAKGQLIGFVDSDDWIESNMFQQLHDTLISSDADIAICAYYREKRGRIRKMYSDGRVFSMNRKQALSQLVKDKTFRNYVWNKLYRRELFDDIRFPEHMHFEDTAIMYRLFIKAEAFECINVPLYHHIYRVGSIVRPKFYNAESVFQHFKILTDRNRFLHSYDHDIWKLAQNKIAHTGAQIIDRSFLDMASKARNPQIVGECQKELSMVDLRYVQLHYRLQCWFIINHMSLYRSLYQFYRKIFKSKVNFRPIPSEI